VVEPAAKSDAISLEPGSARVEFVDGRVSVLSNGAWRLAILEQLAEKAGFEFFTGDVERRALTLRIEDVPLGEALGTLLAGVPYSLEYDHDAETDSPTPVRLTVGRPVSVAAAQQPEPERSDDERQSESSRQASSQIEIMRQRLRAISPEKQQQLLDAHAARAEAMEPELLELLEDPDPAVRADAVLDLPLNGEGEKAAERLQRLRALLEDPDSQVRLAVLERLGESSSPEAVDPLFMALSDPSRDVVLAAIEALEDIDDPSAIPHLEPLRQDRDPEIRAAAEFAIEWLEW
jgi:HEAT repeat protein